MLAVTPMLCLMQTAGGCSLSEMPSGEHYPEVWGTCAFSNQQEFGLYCLKGVQQLPESYLIHTECTLPLNPYCLPPTPHSLPPTHYPPPRPSEYTYCPGNLKLMFSFEVLSFSGLLLLLLLFFIFYLAGPGWKLLSIIIFWFTLSK